MKAYIDDVRKRVYIDDPSCHPDDAYFMGFRFGIDYAALVVVEGWSIYFLTPPYSPDPWREVVVMGAHGLAAAIREGLECTHSCPRHPKHEAAG